MTLQFPIKKIARLLIVLILILSALHLSSHLIHNSLDNRVSELLVEKFSFDLEANFPTFFSSLILFMSSVLFFLIGSAQKFSEENKGYKYWFGLGLIFIFLATDEAAHIHEHFDTDLLWGTYESIGIWAWPWIFVYGGLVSLFVIGYFRFWWRMPKLFKFSYMLAGCIYVGSALGFEMLEALEYSTNQNTYTTKYLALSSIEELFEMSAISFLVYTNLRYLARIFPSTSFSFAEDRKQTTIKKAEKEQPAFRQAVPEDLMVQ